MNGENLHHLLKWEGTAVLYSKNGLKSLPKLVLMRKPNHPTMRSGTPMTAFKTAYKAI